ncbi:MAG: hypothetical protein RL757_1075 [Bacteroidota bacterium]|jgi:predicted CoA-binding protein
MKKTIILGATDNAERYAYKATVSLTKHGFEAVPVGIRGGKIGDLTIEKPETVAHLQDVDTVTLYINAGLQANYEAFLLALKPRRVIFNPGTENDELAILLRKNDIEPVEACTLVLLSIGAY